MNSRRRFPTPLNLFALFKSQTKEQPKRTFTEDLETYGRMTAAEPSGFTPANHSWTTLPLYQMKFTNDEVGEMAKEIGDVVYAAAKIVARMDAEQREYTLEQQLQLRLIERGFDRYMARQMVDVFKELVRDINAGKVNLG